MPRFPLLFDTHVHLDFLPEGLNPEEEMQEARRVGVGEFLVPGVHRSGWPRLLHLARKHPREVWIAPGLHPLAAGEWNESARRELEDALSEPGSVAVGEIGLDGLAEVPQDVQERAFQGQVRVAIEAGLPVLIHCRRGIERLLSILRQEGGERVGGILHAFSGSAETARQAIEMGFAISFGGVLTYLEARRAPEVLRSLPPEWIVLETDAPDIPPHPHRGEANRPSWLSLVAGKVGEIRGWSAEETARVTTENAKRILRL